MSKNLYSKGISLIEVIIGISIIVILLSVVMPQFSNIKQKQLLENAQEDVITTLNKARSSTLASLNSSSYGVHFNSNEIVFFVGETFIDGDSDNQIIEIYNPFSISNISLTGGVSSLYFHRLNGLPSAWGSITISNGTLSRTINILATGTVEIN